MLGSGLHGCPRNSHGARIHLAGSVRSKAQPAITKAHAPPPRGFFFVLVNPPMLPDLEFLVQLQRLEDTAAAARAQIEALPARLDALEAAVTASSDEVASARRRLEAHKVDRQALEKELAQVQTRLTRFKEQLMEVKTNKEYQAMQSEIARSQEEVQRLEDRLLERMLEADDLTAEVQQAERRLAEERSTADQERLALETEREALETQLTRFADERSKLAGAVSRGAMSLFEMLAQQRKGVAVVKAFEGHCTSCRVRLRPQLFNDLRLNERLIQCESCQRILYFDPNFTSEAIG